MKGNCRGQHRRISVYVLHLPQEKVVSGNEDEKSRIGFWLLFIPFLGSLRSSCPGYIERSNIVENFVFTREHHYRRNLLPVYESIYRFRLVKFQVRYFATLYRILLLRFYKLQIYIIYFRMYTRMSANTKRRKVTNQIYVSVVSSIVKAFKRVAVLSGSKYNKHT